MRWEDERYVRVYTRDTAEWLALGWEAQALLLLLLRKCDRAGIVHTGRAGVRGLAALAVMPVDIAQRAAQLLLDDGCLRETDGGYVFPNFLAAQEARSTDAQRKREQRARDREKAIASGKKGSASGLDAEATMERKSGHNAVTASQNVTDSVTSVTPYCHTEQDNVTASRTNVTPSLAVPSRAEPDLASQGAASADAGQPVEEEPPEAAPEDVQEVATCRQEWPVNGRERLVLTSPVAPRRVRAPSAAETLYANLQTSRRERCEQAGAPWVDERWAPARQNKTLGPLAKLPKDSEEAERLNAAWGEFLTDENGKELDVPWALAIFLLQRARWEGRALKRGLP